MSNSKPMMSVVAAGIFLSASSVVLAEANTASRVTTLGEEIAVLRMEQKKAEIEAKIRDIQQQGTKPDSAAAVPASGVIPGMPTEPTVVGIAIVGKSAQASLRFPNGGVKDVVPGDPIEGGYRVTKITSSGVELTRNGKATWLAPSSR